MGESVSGVWVEGKGWGGGVKSGYASFTLQYFSRLAAVYSVLCADQAC